MSHFAYVPQIVDGKGIVEQVIRIAADVLATGGWGNPLDWIQTSYNTVRNQHTQGGTPLRGNYAGIGFIYDQVNDVFYPPRPYPSWTLNESIWDWEPPIPIPSGGGSYEWDEATLSWKPIASGSPENPDV